MYEVIGHSDRFIYFIIDGKHIYIKSTLPKTDLILKLNISPKLVNTAREVIYESAQKKKLSRKEQMEFIEYKNFGMSEEYGQWLNQI